MAQRYINTQPSLGANFYQSYAAVGTGTGPALPTQLTELGIIPGATVNGSFGTRWLFGTLSPGVALTAGTATTYSTTTYVVGVAGSACTPLVSITSANANGNGVWVEISGATLNLAPLMMEAETQGSAELRERAAEQMQQFGQLLVKQEQERDQFLEQAKEEREQMLAQAGEVEHA